MSVISTFEPKLQYDLYEKAVSEYGEDKVVHIRKSKLYLINVVIIPLIIVIWLFGGFAWWLTSLMDITTMFYKIVIGVLILTSLIVLNELFMAFMVYVMDFILITPSTFVKNKQHGIFKRDFEMLEIQHIKSVRVNKKWLFQSIFDIGALIIYSDGVEKMSNPMSIRFRYVKHPEKCCNQIEKLLSNK